MASHGYLREQRKTKPSDSKPSRQADNGNLFLDLRSHSLGGTEEIVTNTNRSELGMVCVAQVYQGEWISRNGACVCVCACVCV